MQPLFHQITLTACFCNSETSCFSRGGNLILKRNLDKLNDNELRTEHDDYLFLEEYKYSSFIIMQISFID